MTAVPRPPAETPRPARVLPVIVLSQFAGTSLWFAGNALLPDLERRLELGEHSVAAVTSAVQLGFIALTGPISLVPERRITRVGSPADRAMAAVG